MKNETAHKIAFFILVLILISLLSLLLCSADFFSTAVLALIVGVFCWDIEKNFKILKKEGHPKNSEPIAEYEGEIKSGKVSAYVINLDRASKRWAFIEPQVKKLKIPYERVSATDGKQLSKELIKDIVDDVSYTKFFRMHPEVGTIGCSLSHEHVWRQFLKSDNEFALVIEDDVAFDSDKLREAIEFATQNKDLWDILSFESNHYGHPQKIAKFTYEKSGEDSFLVLYITNVKHAGAYLIGRNTAKKLLEKFYPIKMPLDHYYSRSWEFDLRFCGVEPRIVEQKFGDSQIKNEVCEKLSDSKTLAAKIGYEIYTESIRSLYNDLLYLTNRMKL